MSATQSTPLLHPAHSYPSRMHLVFLIHGLLGNPTHLGSMKESLREAMGTKYKKEMIVYRAQSMTALATFDGVEKNAHRLLIELTAKIDEIKPTHISIVGYSMGGLCGRYLIGLLEEAHTLEAITPVLFATFATPHLGSAYTKEGAFGKAFNFVGAHVSGDTGPDLFGTSSLLDDLADSEKQFYRGLQRFRYLYLFANAFGDRTVNFWTAYLAPKNPFEKRSRMDLHLYEQVPVVVDMSKSRYVENAPAPRPRPFKHKALRGAIKVILPFALVVLTSSMATITLISKVKQRLNSDDEITDTIKRIMDRNRSTEAVAGGFGFALDETLDLVAPNREPHHTLENETAGVPEPSLNGGFEGLIDSSPSSLLVSPASQTQMASLNKLPWRKFAVAFSRFQTHGDIVDRKGDSHEGKQLMNFFAAIVAQTHAATYKRPSKL